MDDKIVRQRIVGKYGFVDQAEDNRYHRPIIKKDVSLHYSYFYGIPEWLQRITLVLIYCVVLNLLIFL